MPALGIPPHDERTIVAYLVFRGLSKAIAPKYYSVNSIFLVGLVGGVMSSKYRIDLSEHAAVRGTKNRYIGQDQDALTLAGHECRDQLNRLVMASEKVFQLVDDTLNSEMSAAMKCVRQNAVSMRCAINNYLNLTRLGNGKLIVHPTLIDPVRDVLEPVIASYADLFEARKLTSQLKANRPGLLIWADQALLINVYDNLIHDLLEFGEPGGAIIFSVTERGNVDEFSVWSRGQAPDLKCLEHLTYSDTIASKKRNIEIGMYLANKIIEAHGGRLEVETRAGAWVNFTFTLPKREVASRGRAMHTNAFSFHACL
jgi:signal transduction histidine kinase